MDLLRRAAVFCTKNFYSLSSFGLILVFLLQLLSQIGEEKPTWTLLAFGFTVGLILTDLVDNVIKVRHGWKKLKQLSKDNQEGGP